MSASTTYPTGIFRIAGHGLLAVLGHVGRGLVRLAEAGPRMAAVRKLNAMSDEELAAKGVTRADMVRHIFGPAYYL